MLLSTLVIYSIFCAGKPSTSRTDTVINKSSEWLGTTSKKYNGPQIVRLAWGSVPEQFTSVPRFKELKESGITHNFNWYYSNADEAEKALNAAFKAGVKVILNCPEIATDPEGIVARFKNHPALAGYNLGDEPNSDIFAAYAALAKRIRVLDKNHYCYVNLPRITHLDTHFGKGKENYKEYVNDFITKFNPGFLSYDNYTIYYPKDKNELTTDPHMFENLEIIRDAATKANISFWAFCLTASHSVGFGKRRYPEPSTSMMRLYVYSDLAYGAQGIEYFTYWLPPVKDTSIVRNSEKYFSAPISDEGKRGPVYDRLRMINTEIRNLSFVFAGATVKWVRHTGSQIPMGTTKLNNELESTPFTTLIASGGLIISLLKKADRNYLVVVNRDYSRPIDLNIQTDRVVKRILKSGVMIPSEEKLEISEGDAAIYTWKSNKRT